MGNSGGKKSNKVHVEQEKSAVSSTEASEHMQVDTTTDSCTPAVVPPDHSSTMDSQGRGVSPRPSSCSPTQKREDILQLLKSRSGGSSPSARHISTSPDLGAESISLSVDKATSHCKVLLMQLSSGSELDRDQLKQSLSYIMDVLQSFPVQRTSISSLGCGRLETLDDDEVRAWLTSTFTHSDSKQSDIQSKPSFKAVVDTIMVGQYFQKKMQDTPVSYPDGVEEFFKTNRDQWCCDVFQLDSLTTGQPLKYLGHELFRFYGFFDQYKISNATLNSFLEVVEQGYKKHDNPYHNSIHAADVTQTVHYFIQSTGLQKWLSSIEILSMIFSAIVHDLEHTGTTNAFHVKTRSELALCYNDASVLENYHLYKAFSVLTEDSSNILKGVSNEDFVVLRSLVIEMVLATDMSKHFEHLKHLKKLIHSHDAWTKIQEGEKPKVLSLFLHMADISHPGKKLDLHEKWTSRLVKEFFKQGDKEKELELPYSPLCDRNTTRIPESQIGFINVIVSPAYDVCGSMMELIIKKLSIQQQLEGEESTDTTIDKTTDSSHSDELRVWDKHIKENKLNWSRKCKQKSLATADED